MNPKITEQINDIKGDNLKKIIQIFPNILKDGMIDFEELREELAEELGEFEEVSKEKFELTWAGKKDAKKKAFEDITGKTLNYIQEDEIGRAHV